RTHLQILRSQRTPSDPHASVRRESRQTCAPCLRATCSPVLSQTYEAAAKFTRFASRRGLGYSSGKTYSHQTNLPKEYKSNETSRRFHCHRQISCHPRRDIRKG